MFVRIDYGIQAGVSTVERNKDVTYALLMGAKFPLPKMTCLIMAAATIATVLRPRPNAEEKTKAANRLLFFNM